MTEASTSHELRNIVVGGLIVAFVVGLVGVLGNYIHIPFINPLASTAPTYGVVASPSGPTTPSSASPCPAGSDVSWSPDGGHEAWASDHLDTTLAPCQTLMVASRGVDFPSGVHCDQGPMVVCVVVYHSTSEWPIHVGGLTPGAPWWGLTMASVDSAIADKAQKSLLGWWGPNNCQGGCFSAIVVTDLQGSVSGPRTLTPSP